MCGPLIPDTGEVEAEKHKFRESSERAWDTYRDCVKIESKIRAGDIVQRWLLSMHNTLTLAGSAMEEKKGGICIFGLRFTKMKIQQAQQE